MFLFFFRKRLSNTESRKRPLHEREKTLLFCWCMRVAEEISQPRRGEIITKTNKIGHMIRARKVRSGSMRIITNIHDAKRNRAQHREKAVHRERLDRDEVSEVNR